MIRMIFAIEHQMFHGHFLTYKMAFITLLRTFILQIIAITFTAFYLNNSEQKYKSNNNNDS